MTKTLTFKFALCGVLSALATIAFVIEGLFPPLFLPGARMGVSNVFILLCAILLGGRYAFITLAVKVLLGSLLSGNFFGTVYALPSGAIALTIELVLIYFVKNVSIIATSIAGAVINIAVQNTAFCLITGTAEYLSYLPYLALTGILGGIIVGLAVFLLIKILPAKYFLANNNKQQEKQL
jgi:heptaprenyl diphosphate synthase